MHLSLNFKNLYSINKSIFSNISKINYNSYSYVYCNILSNLVNSKKLNLKNSKDDESFKSKDEYLKRVYFYGALLNYNCKFLLKFSAVLFSENDYSMSNKSNINKLNLLQNAKNSILNIYIYGKRYNIHRNVIRENIFHETLKGYILLSKEINEIFKKWQTLEKQTINSNIQKPKNLPKSKIKSPQPVKKDMFSHKKPIPPIPPPKPNKSICKNILKQIINKTH